MQDAERVRAVCSAIPTALDCTGDLVAGCTISLPLETSALCLGPTSSRSRFFREPS